MRVDGRWTLPDTFLLAFAEELQREGVFQKVFFDGLVRTPEGFHVAMQKPTNLPVFFFEGTEPLGFAWLNGLSGGVAFAHFCALKASGARTVEMGQMAIDYWFAAFPFLRVLMGTTPANNRLALRFIKRLGFTSLGEVPDMLYDAYAAKPVGGVISYLGR